MYPSITLYNSGFCSLSVVESSDGVADYSVSDQLLEVSQDIATNVSQEVGLVGDSPRGRLKSHFKFWQNLTASGMILGIIFNGYRIPCFFRPLSVFLVNNRSAVSNSKFVTQEIYNLLSKGCVSEVPDMPEVVNPLSVSFNRAGKPRLILDLRHVNQFLFKHSFKMEDIDIARKTITVGSSLFSFDIKSAYHHIEIHEQDRGLLGFSWLDDSKVRYFVFNVLPFGLSTAPFIFTKITKTLVTKWRSQGLNVVMYLDDGLGGSLDPTQASDNAESVRKDLLDAGFLLSDKKCFW